MTNCFASAEDAMPDTRILGEFPTVPDLILNIAQKRSVTARYTKKISDYGHVNSH